MCEDNVQLELTMFTTLWSRFISLKIALFEAASYIKQNILLGQGTAWKISWRRLAENHCFLTISMAYLQKIAPKKKMLLQGSIYFDFEFF